MRGFWWIGRECAGNYIDRCQGMLTTKGTKITKEKKEFAKGGLGDTETFGR